jgi:AcrR family transcriptional regulator
MAGKPRMRAPARRARITEAAVEIFARSGYHGTAMNEIATAADVTRSVLYDHFPSKKVLFLSVMQEQNAALIAHVGARITGDGSAEERMRATVDAYLSFAEDHPWARRLLFDAVGEGDPEISAVRWGIREARTRAVAALLARDVRRIGLEPETPLLEGVVELLIAGLDGMAQWWERNREMPRECLVAAAMRVLWTGLGHGA